jgi:LysM repeat protein
MALQEQPLRELSDIQPEAAGGEEDALLDQLLNFEPGAGETTPDATPEATQEETYIVQQGDTLNKISQDLGIPLNQLAEQNQITDVNVITPGQEIKYKKPGAAPAEEGMQIGGETITLQEGGTTEEGVLGAQPETAPGDMVTRTDTEGDIDFEAKPVAEADIDSPPVDEKTEVVLEEPGDAPDLEEESKVRAKLVSDTVGATLSPERKGVFDKVSDEIEKLGVTPVTDIEKFYEDIAKNVNDQIQKYDDKIAEIAEEKRKPTFEGWNKFLAVLGAAMGAYGSAMTGTPNYAQKILDNAIDRDIQEFTKSKEIRTKSLSDQRMELIMRRGELLQMAQNKVNQIMQSETFKLQKQEIQANLINLEKGIEQKEKDLEQQRDLLIFTKMVDVYTADQSLRATLGKEQRKQMVNSFSATDSKGNPVLITGYVARDVDTAKKLTAQQKDALKVLDILSQLDELHQSETKYWPAWAGGSDKSRINTLTADLELLLKERMGMGANYSEYEQSRIKAIVPGTDITDMLFQHKTKSDQLRDEVIKKLKNDKSVESFGEAGNNKEAERIIKTGKSNLEKFGMKTGYGE